MKKQILLVLTAFFILLATPGLFAQGKKDKKADAPKKEWVTTGSGIRVKKIAFVSVKVYSLMHQAKEPLPAKNAQEVINAETDKRFFLKLMRDLDSQKIINAINDAYSANGYSNKANQDKLWGIIKGDLKENDQISITYNPQSKSVTLSYKGASSTVAGSDFMKATWSIWFGKIDQSSLTNSLMSNLK